MQIDKKFMIKLEQRLQAPWHARKDISQLNVQFGTNYTLDDYYETIGKQAPNKALILIGGDDHYGSRLRVNDGKDTVVYSPEIYHEGVLDFLERLDWHGNDFNWFNQIKELVYINCGDLLEGNKVHKKQPWLIAENCYSMKQQRQGIIKDGIKPILDWGKKRFGSSRMTISLGNHEDNGYDCHELDNAVFDLVDDLVKLGYDARCDEIEPLWNFTESLGWGIMSTHGRKLPPAKKDNGPLMQYIKEQKIYYPQAQIFCSGHYHLAKNLTILDTGDKRSVFYYRVGTAKLGDRHGASYGHPSHDWHAVILSDVAGVVDHATFSIAKRNNFAIPPQKEETCSTLEQT